MIDFFPALVLVMVLLTWGLDERIRTHKGLRAALWMGVGALALATVAIGFFTAFDVPPSVFRLDNPELYGRLAAGWNAWFQLLQTVLGRLGLTALTGGH